MDAAATIPTGAMAERWKFSSFFVYGWFVAALIYPSTAIGSGAAAGWPRSGLISISVTVTPTSPAPPSCT